MKVIASGYRVKAKAGANGGPPEIYTSSFKFGPSGVFSANQNDLHCEMPVSFTTAALGGDIDIPTLEWTCEDQDPARNTVGPGVRLRARE